VSLCISIHSTTVQKKREYLSNELKYRMGSFRSFSLHSHDQVNILVEVKRGLKLDWMFALRLSCLSYVCWFFFIAWVHRWVNHFTSTFIKRHFFFLCPLRCFGLFIMPRRVCSDFNFLFDWSTFITCDWATWLLSWNYAQYVNWE